MMEPREGEQNEDTHIMTSVETILGTGAYMEGTLKVQGDARIEGHFKGKIQVDGNLTVGESGQVEGEIHAKNAIVNGHVKGELYVEEKVEFQANARFEGEVECKGLIVHDGVTFDGTCYMSKKKSQRSADFLMEPGETGEPTYAPEPREA